MELYDWSNWSPCEASLSLLPQRLALDFEAFPIALSAGQLHLAVSEDCDLDQQDLLEHLLKQRLVFWRASKEVIQEKITRHYPRENLAASALAFREPKVSFDHSQLDYFENTLHEAIAQGASDIHFEPFEKNIRLRYRIDGRLRLAGELPKSIHGAFINALKVRANLPIDQHKNPLDGRLSVRVKAGDYDLRLAFLPTVYGQSLVVRILEKNAQSIDLSSMLLSAENARRLQNLLALENGLVLVVGPTGSGKTTTLYAMLKELIAREKKIFTIEDPIEYQVPGLNQIALNKSSNLDYAAVIKSILRQSPDLMMLGEIRDSKSARAAMEAAHTGHLVFSTLHASDSISAIARLTDLGLDPFFLSSGLKGVIAQRLVRKVCQSCNVNLKESCLACKGSGFLGRCAVMEVLEVSPSIAQAIHEGAPAESIYALAQDEGFLSMAADGWDKVEQGITQALELEDVPHLNTKS